MRYKAVLFDMDGTILDTLEDLKSAVNRTLREFSMPECSLEQIRCYVGNGALRLIERAVPTGTSPEKIQEVLAWYKDYYDKNSIISTCPYPGINELMTELKERGMKLAVVSNKPDSTVRELAERFFPGLFQCAIGQQDSIARKPAPDMLYLAVNEMGTQLSDCVYVGDSEVDIITARNAGMDCISVLWGFRTLEELAQSQPQCVVHTAQELLEKLI